MRVFVWNEQGERVLSLRGAALVTPGAAKEAPFSVGASGARESQPGRNSVHIMVELPINPTIHYRFDPIFLTVNPEAP